MGKASVIVYWIDEGFSIQSKVLHPYHLKGSATYKSEAWHISNDAEHIVIIDLDHAGNASEIECVESLKKKAYKLRTNDL